MVKTPAQPHTGFTVAESIDRYLTACRLRNFSGYTLRNYRHGLNDFIRWCEDRALHHPEDLTPAHLNSYRRAVFHYTRQHSPDSEPLKPKSQMKYLTPVRGLFRWLVEKHLLAYNPAAQMDMPRFRQALPQGLLSQREVEKILAQVDVTSPLGLRDRALLELAYSTGLRRSELANLKTQDIHLKSGWVLVQDGKGGKDRRIPIGERACLWLNKYLSDQRPHLVKQCLGKQGDHDSVFVYANGKPMSNDRIYRCIHAYIEAADLGKQGGSHLLRHAMATHMLEAGADIRYIQQMLGHEQLTSTQIYTRVQDNKLKEVHNQTHPAQVKRQAEQADKRRGNQGEVDET